MTALGVLVREPDRHPSSAAGRALLALGLRWNRCLRRPARRVVRRAPGGEHGLTRPKRPLQNRGPGPCVRTRHTLGPSSRCARPRAQLIAGIVLGPLLWLVALIVAAWLFEYSLAIRVGPPVTFAAFVVSLVVLTVLERAASGRRIVTRRETGRSGIPSAVSCCWHSSPSTRS